MKNIKIILIILLLFTTNCYAGILLPKGKVTLKVVDSKGNSVDDAEVSLRIDTAKGPGMGWGTNVNLPFLVPHKS